MVKMTTEEAFVKVLQKHGIEHAFGIIGSAFMPISDLFPKAGIKFWDVAHESNGGLIADGYTRSTGKIAMCIAQNGPGITGFWRGLACGSRAGLGSGRSLLSRLVLAEDRVLDRTEDTHIASLSVARA